MLAQIWMLGDKIAQRLADGLCRYFNDGLLPGVGPERRGNQDFDGHILPFKNVVELQCIG
jgi:hypothetical protein